MDSKKIYIYIISCIFAFSIFVLTGCAIVKKDTQSQTNFNDSSVQPVQENGTTENENMKNALNKLNELESEEQISTFSTPLKSKDPNRQDNIYLTCSKIDGTIIEDGQTFSFNDIVGEPTIEGGYKRADVMSHGEMVKDIGGGNCQVSTTIYNAALEAGSDIEITERHEHGKPVAYVEEGKDATVSFGGYDLKFVNHTGRRIKLNVSSDGQNVTATIFKI